jgi:hypothetical protein
MHGRFFGGQRIIATQSDGKEKFKLSKDTDGEAQKRQDAYNKWLETQDGDA